MRIASTASRPPPRLRQALPLLPRPAAAPAPCRRRSIVPAAVKEGLDADGVSQLKRKVGEVRQRVEDIVGVVDLKGMRQQLASLENDATTGDIWNDSAKATKLVSQV